MDISPMAINYYEKEERKPDMNMIKALAKALNVRVTDFLAYRDAELVFCHGEFKKNNSMSAKQQEFVREEVEEYFGRFFQVVAILGGEVLPRYPELHSLELSESAEDSALRMRECLDLPKNGPVGGLIGSLENKGFLIYLCDIQNEDFAGMNVTENEITIQKGAELLREPYEKVAKACSVMEVVNGIC